MPKCSWYKGMNDLEHIQTIKENFKFVNLGLLKEFVYKRKTKAAIEQIDLDIKKLYENVDVLVGLKTTLEKELKGKR